MNRSYIFLIICILGANAYGFDKISFVVESVHNDNTLSYFIETTKNDNQCNIIIKNKKNKSIKRKSDFVCKYIEAKLVSSNVLRSNYKSKYKVILERLKFDYIKNSKKLTITIPMSQKLSGKELKYNVLILIYKYLNDVYLYGDPEVSKILLFDDL